MRRLAGIAIIVLVLAGCSRDPWEQVGDQEFRLAYGLLNEGEVTCAKLLFEPAAAATDVQRLLAARLGTPGADVAEFRAEAEHDVALKNSLQVCQATHFSRLKAKHGLSDQDISSPLARERARKLQLM